MSRLSTHELPGAWSAFASLRLKTLRSLMRSTASPKGSFRTVGLALGVGAAVGLMVMLVKTCVSAAQSLTLGFAAEHHVADPAHVHVLKVVGALCVGAVLINYVSVLAERLDRRHGREAPIDAIEANALRGGKLTVHDGVSVVGPILTSVGCGASVGIEAAVTQVGAVLASLVGRQRRLQRSETRLLVGAGVAAAIGAAYGAPIAGTLYAFELALGQYSTRLLAPVGLAALAASVIAGALQHGGATFETLPVGVPLWSDYPLAVLIGAMSALVGIGTMLLVSGCERLARRTLPRPVLRLLAGAVCMGLLGSVVPGVLGSGHAGLQATLGGEIVGLGAAGFLAAKVLASAVSLGSGFKGGLFSASLMIGALLGQVVATSFALIPGFPHVTPALCMSVGMASVGASVIGSPLAMIFLVLESGGSVHAAVAVATGAVISAFLTGRLFGYSFSTWRFQQRGLALEGGHDVSRLSAVSIEGIVRPPKRRIQADAGIDEVIRAVSVAAARGTSVHAQDGSFIGLIDYRLVELLEDDLTLPVCAADLIYLAANPITLKSKLPLVLDLFQFDDRATVAVVDAKDSSHLVGCIRARDAYLLASQHLDEQRRMDLGNG